MHLADFEITKRRVRQRSMLFSWLLKVVKFVLLVVPRENRASTVLRSKP
jgi:hypothetical protein